MCPPARILAMEILARPRDVGGGQHGRCLAPVRVCLIPFDRRVYWHVCDVHAMCAPFLCRHLYKRAQRMLRCAERGETLFSAQSRGCADLKERAGALLDHLWSDRFKQIPRAVDVRRQTPRELLIVDFEKPPRPEPATSRLRGDAQIDVVRGNLRERRGVGEVAHERDTGAASGIHVCSERLNVMCGASGADDTPTLPSEMQGDVSPEMLDPNNKQRLSHYGSSVVTTLLNPLLNY
jgi:hypothetical protein